ncbi:MAG: glutathione peroxidase [Chromatiales bacterium]|nr:glutathione peroxidase [Chromatiales bacterium]
MRWFLVFLFLSLGAPAVAADACPSTLDFEKRPLNGKEPVRLCDLYAGKVVLIVNTASKCAYTPQYDGLEALYDREKDRGLVILGFPSNDFGGQEPGTEKQVQEFCRLTYGVKFPMFEKTHAAQKDADPLYRKLANLAGEYPRWNFHKYLLDRQGNVVGSFRSQVRPDSKELLRAIEAQL